MPATVSIHINAECPEDLLTALRTLTSTLNAQGQTLAVTNAAEVESGHIETVVAPKRGRGRPEKDDTTEETGTLPANDDDANATDAGQPEQVRQSEPAMPDLTGNVVSDMPPKEALALANKLMQDFFLKDGDAAMVHVNAIQKKFGIKQFVDLPLERAHEFLADVKLATSNNGERAA